LWLSINLDSIIPEAASDFPRKNAGKVSQKCNKIKPENERKARSTPQGQKRADVLLIISLCTPGWIPFIYSRLQKQAILRRKNQSRSAAPPHFPKSVF